ncbi:HD domain-containing protein [Halobaculum sp. CBA1158]|uniref:HD domain-containing protein n=1 Tax=Halobaculum sp. CBA1158 TaxID=2904243 RepID=UPI001F183376|nr:HD domain-containing protein [Halobaculum sp. CBA1158]UIP00883.1 HD domain-containing protein [Halobaculum sp. CBA1158]
MTDDGTSRPTADHLPDDLAEVFPAYAEIGDDDLRDGVRDAYALALAETDWTDLAAVPWLPDEQARLGLPDETNVTHVNDVTALATALADALTDRRPGLGLDRDLVVAGALVHDVSKLYEFAPDQGGDAGSTRSAEGSDADCESEGPAVRPGDSVATEYYDLLGHPYVGVHVCEAAELPVALSHVVLSHTDRTTVEPATPEAVVVKRADEVAAAAIRSRALDDLRDA